MIVEREIHSYQVCEFGSQLVLARPTNMNRTKFPAIDYDQFKQLLPNTRLTLPISQGDIVTFNRIWIRPTYNIFHNFHYITIMVDMEEQQSKKFSLANPLGLSLIFSSPKYDILTNKACKTINVYDITNCELVPWTTFGAI